MMGYQGQSLSLIFSVLLIYVSVAVTKNADNIVIVMEETGNLENTPQSSPSQNEEFRLWIENQQQRVVEKIMDKISSPNDTYMQHEAKMAVARYLVNVTFTAMTKRLETLKQAKKQGVIPATAGLPVSAPVVPVATNNLIITSVIGNEIQSSHATTTQGPAEEEGLMFNGKAGAGESTNNTSLPSSPSGESLPASLPLPAMTFPASSTPERQSATMGSNLNETGTTTPGSNRPIWEEILTFNFSAALNGGGESGLLGRLNISAFGNGGDGGGLLSRLNISALGGGGGENLFDRFNFTAFGGGEGNLFDRLNLTALGGGSGSEGNLFDRLNFTALGGGSEGNSLLERLNLTGGGEGGGLFDILNITGFTGGSGNEGGLFSRFNFSSLGGEGGGNGLLIRLNFSSNSEGGQGSLPFNLEPPPEGLFNYPTPPPMNDSVRVSQMFLGSQIEKIMGDISNSNLTGIVEATINIATPSTVGVLVNALLNIVLCNPLDRFNGNCGIE